MEPLLVVSPWVDSLSRPRPRSGPAGPRVEPPRPGLMIRVRRVGGAVVAAWGRLPASLTFGLNLVSVIGFWTFALANFLTGTKGHGINSSWRIAGLFYFGVCLVSALRGVRALPADSGAIRRQAWRQVVIYGLSTLCNIIAVGVIFAVGAVGLGVVDYVTFGIICAGTALSLYGAGRRWTAEVELWFGGLCRVVPQFAMAVNFWLTHSAGLTYGSLGWLWVLGALRLLTVGHAYQEAGGPYAGRLLRLELSNAASLVAVTVVWTWLRGWH